MDSGADSASPGDDATTTDSGVEAQAVESGPAPCVAGRTQCQGNSVAICGANGEWGPPSACPAMRTCVAGFCESTSAASCAAGGDGLTNCGSGGESCCASLDLAGGSYSRTYTNTGGGPTGTADPATVSTFSLDKYEVTVGRFRQFVNAWNGGAGWLPAAGSGKHAHLNGGQGLVQTQTSAPSDSGVVATDAGPTYETGWVASDDGYVAPTTANLTAGCDMIPADATWTAAPAGNEKLPIDCVNWYEAYAFCIWDGGFLPSETEWEYAAAGGSQQREYPWGVAPPGTANQYAIYGGEGDGVCYYPDGGTCAGFGNIAPVGTPVAGAGLWGQLDLGGNVDEWSLDSPNNYGNPCTDCASLAPQSSRVFRGGAYFLGASALRAWVRDNEQATSRPVALGIRCARAP